VWVCVGALGIIGFSQQCAWYEPVRMEDTEIWRTLVLRVGSSEYEVTEFAERVLSKQRDNHQN
jgi:hypothetical protein